MENRIVILPLKAAAKAIGVKPESLKSDADADRVPFTKVGDEYLFLLTALESAIAERAQGKAVVNA